MLCRVSPIHQEYLLELQSPAAVKTENQVILVLDVSGSMSGKPINAIREMVEHYRKHESKDHISVITYHDTASPVTPIAVAQVYGGGGTNFFAPIEAMKTLLSQPDLMNKSLTFIFFTDGEHTAGRLPQLDTQMRLFRGLANARKQSVTVHAISYGTQTSQPFLERVAEMGRNKGSFRFANSSQEIESKFDDLFLLNQNPTFKVELNGTLHEVMMSEVNGHWEGVVVVKQPVTSLTVMVHTPNNKVCVPVEHVPATNLLQMKYWDQYVIQSEEDVVKVMKHVAEIPHRASGLTQQLLMDQYRKDINHRMTEYLHMFNQIRLGQVSQAESKMRLGELRYEVQFDASRRNRRMALRVNENTRVMQDMDQKLRVLKQNILPSEWKELEAQKEDFTCIYSQKNLLDVMKEDDMDIMCIGLYVERDEVVIDSPSTGLRIRNIANSFISFQAFTDAMSRAMQKKGIDAHGGFQPAKSSAEKKEQNDKTEDLEAYCIVGQSREKINAVLPLYIHPAHMSRVQALVPYWCGYLFTLDPYGYNYNQLMALQGFLGYLMMTTPRQGFWQTVYDQWQLLCLNLQKHPDFTQAWTPEKHDQFLHTFYGRRKELVQNLLCPIGYHYARYGLMQWDELVRSIVAENTKRQIMNDYSGDRITTREKVYELMYGENYRQVRQQVELEGSPLLAEHDAQQRESLYAQALRTRAVVPEPVIPSYQLQNLSRWMISPWDPTHQQLVLTPTITPVLEKLQAKYNTCSIIQAVNKNLAYDQPWQDSMEHQYRQYLHHFSFSQGYTEFEPAGIVTRVHDHLTQEEIKKTQGHSQQERIAYLSQWFLQCQNVMAFAGMLCNLCPTREGPLFQTVVADVLRQNDRDKLRCILTNTVFDTEQNAYVPVYTGPLANVIWIPNSKEQLEAIRRIVGETELKEIETQNIRRAPVQNTHIYRSSGVPNRHGHSNANPNPKFVRGFSGYETELKLK